MGGRLHKLFPKPPVDALCPHATRSHSRTGWGTDAARRYVSSGRTPFACCQALGSNRLAHEVGNSVYRRWLESTYRSIDDCRAEAHPGENPDQKRNYQISSVFKEAVHCSFDYAIDVPSTLGWTTGSRTLGELP